MLPTVDGVRYRIPGPKVIHEAFDDEVIVSNLDKGHYYSVEGSGAVIWRLLLEGATVPQIVEYFTGDDPHAVESVASRILEFVSQLLEEGLISRSDDAGGKSPAMDLPPNRPVAFAMPVLRKYTDMEELLRLDPIHEVDETGWPNIKRTD